MRERKMLGREAMAKKLNENDTMKIINRKAEPNFVEMR